jgi:ribosomal protein S19
MRSSWKGLFSPIITRSNLDPNLKKDRIKHLLRNFRLNLQVKPMTEINIKKVRFAYYKTRCRSIRITSKITGLSIYCHNGRTFARRKYISNNLLKGRPKKIGDFVSTRKI